MNILPGTNIKSILSGWSISTIVLIWFLSVISVQIKGQDIRIDVQKAPLDEVLMDLAVEYGIQLTFNDRAISNYTVTLTRTFDSPEKALSVLIGRFPLEYEKIGDVYAIYSRRKPVRKKNWRLSGRVSDHKTSEALPYSHLLINNTGIISDFYGHFTYASSEDSVFDLKISYLGYFIHDTVLHAGTGHQIKLLPSIVGLEEVTVEGSTLERSGEQGTKAGVINLNHKIAYRLPGNGDNAVFNLLRLQPGILASGERSSEMIIWGSYSGHSKISFDGITIFGLKNFNDNISFVNPYMVKNIRVLKGGYGVEYGDRVGGIVDISGTTGSYTKPSINLNINNQTVNGMASIPLSERTSLMFAYRHTYYDLYDADDLRVETWGRRQANQADLNVYPDYLFRDFNLKYAGTTRGGDDFFVSLYEGKDQFSYSVDQVWRNNNISQDADEENRQSGGTVHFGRRWKSGNRSHFSTGFSRLISDQFEKQNVFNTRLDSTISSRENKYRNEILQYTIKNKNILAISDKHSLETGLDYHFERINFNQDSATFSIHDATAGSHRLSLYVQDVIKPARGLTIIPGIRLDFPVNLAKIYVQPRIQASLDLAPGIRLNGSWGIYNQFISEALVIDDLGNYRNFWVLCDNESIPVLHANHLVGGITLKENDLTMVLETFYKTTDGITRLFRFPRKSEENIYQGHSRIYGMDILVKKYLGKHEAWISYTLSKTEEYFPISPLADYNEAPHDQRHEVKGAMLLNFKPFYFTVNYVYGSGFPDRPPIIGSEATRYPYSRLDAAVIYRHSIKQYHFEAGISVLNLLNTENIKYSNFIRIPGGQSNTFTLHAEAVPFTPTLFLNLKF